MLSSNLVWSGATGCRKSAYPSRVGPSSASFSSVHLSVQSSAPSPAPSPVLSLSFVLCPSVPSRRVPSSLSSSSVCSVRPSVRAAFVSWSRETNSSLLPRPSCIQDCVLPHSQCMNRASMCLRPPLQCPSKLIESRLVWRDGLQGVCIRHRWAIYNRNDIVLLCAVIPMQRAVG